MDQKEKELVERIFGRIGRGDFGKEAQDIIWALNKDDNHKAAILMEAFERSLSEEDLFQKPMSTMDRVKKFMELSEQIMQIFDSKIPWDTKYDLIFSINKEIRDIEMSFDWHDPDTTYEEDVMYYVDALKQKVKDYRTIIKQ